MWSAADKSALTLSRSWPGSGARQSPAWPHSVKRVDESHTEGKVKVYYIANVDVEKSERFGKVFR